ncbi:MAG: hypothetical protein Fur0035_03370 [Anaerolineales bacterium]
MPLSSRRARLALALLFLLAFALGLAGIDFGYHWDEINLLRSARASYRSGSLLPGWYNYPSVTFDLTLLSSLPQAVEVIRQERGVNTINPLFYLREARGLYREINARLDPFTFPPQMRPLFLFITLLTGIWTYALARELLKSRAAGLLAAALLFSSWEFAYHARWGAPDGLLAQFGALTVWLTLRAAAPQSKCPAAWLTLAAISAALACGSKYYGGLFLLPVLLTALALARRLGWSKTKLGLSLLALGLVFAAAFLLATPGVLLETQQFIHDIRFEMRHYSTFHYGQTVAPGGEHWGLLLIYFALTAFSRFAPLAALIFVLALAGAFSLLTRPADRLRLTLVFGVPLLYVFYMGLQRVLIVRNYLALFPFFAVLAAGGAQMLWRSRLFQTRRAQWFFGLAVFAALSANFGWQAYAAQSIQRRGEISLSACLRQVTESRPQTRFFLSPQARAALAGADFPNQAPTPASADIFLYVSGEIKHPLISNRYGVYETPCGPYELNFNYYPDWEGDPRLVALKMSEARAEPLVGEK